MSVFEYFACTVLGDHINTMKTILYLSFFK